MAFVRLSRRMLLAASAASLSLAVALPARADDTVKLGLVAAMSGNRRNPAKPSFAGCRSRSTRSTPREACSARRLSFWCATTRASRQGRDCRARTGAARKVAAFFGGLDTPVSVAIVPFANQSKVPFYRRVGGGHRNHAQRCAGKLRVPRLGGRRAGGCRAGRLCREKIRCEKTRNDPDQQPLG